jgi:hypothetical protein
MRFNFLYIIILSFLLFGLPYSLNANSGGSDGSAVMGALGGTDGSTDRGALGGTDGSTDRGALGGTDGSTDWGAGGGGRPGKDSLTHCMKFSDAKTISCPDGVYIKVK